MSDKSPDPDPTIDLTNPASPTAEPNGGTVDSPKGADKTKVGNDSNQAFSVDGGTLDDATEGDASNRTQDFDVDQAVKRARRLENVKVPGYEIISELGRGGMGVVYKARDLKLDRPVALKMVLAGIHASDTQIARFVHEAKAVAQFQHPNIVQIYEINEVEGLPYFSLEFVDGGSLEDRLGHKPQTPKYAAETLETLAKAMQYAHDRGSIQAGAFPTKSNF
jgi:serine/threonine protein kinase